MDAYHIAVVGEDVYRRRENIERILTHLQSEKNTVQSEPETAGMGSNVLPDLYEAKDRKSLLIIIRNLFEIATRESGELDFILQPDFTEFFQLLSLMPRKNRTLKIGHIFSVKKNADTRDEKQSLECLNMVLNMSACFQDYEPFYYYDYRNDDRTFLNPAPFWIIYGDFLLLISSHFDAGFLCRNESMSMFYKSLFERQKSECYAAIRKKQDAVSATEYLYQAFKDNSPFLGIDYDLCVMPLLRKDIVLQYLNQDMLPTGDYLRSIFNYLEKIQEYAWSKDGLDIVASVKGFEEFLRTGFPDEIPKNFMKSPIEPEVRIRMLQDMIKLIRKGNYRIRFMKDKDVISKGWSVSSSRDHLMVCQNNDLDTSFLWNPSLISAFYDYQQYIREDPLLMTAEESLDFIEEKVKTGL